MKCKSCDFENVEGALYCSNCGNKMEEMKCCSNPECEYYYRYLISNEALFCPKCGKKIEMVVDAPFHIKHSEYDLVPIEEWRYREDVIFFLKKKPDYIQDNIRSEGDNYHIVAREEKFGVLCYTYHKKLISVFDDHDISWIIPCKYDKIEFSENEDYFICYLDGKKEFFDIRGKQLK